MNGVSAVGMRNRKQNLASTWWRKVSDSRVQWVSVHHAGFHWIKVKRLLEIKQESVWLTCIGFDVGTDVGQSWGGEESIRTRGMCKASTFYWGGWDGGEQEPAMKMIHTCASWLRCSSQARLRRQVQTIGTINQCSNRDQMEAKSQFRCDVYFYFF